MPPPYCYDHPRPAVTVDLAAFAFDGEHLRTLLIRRKHDPFAGRRALPGGFLDADETSLAAARRELKEETGLEVGPVEFLAVFDEPGRDPRGWTISLAYAAPVPWPPPATAGGDDAEAADWLDPDGAHDLAFDHDRILARALALVGSWLVAASPLAITLLPATFTADDYARLLRAAGCDRAAERAGSAITGFREKALVEAVPGDPDRYRAVARGSAGGAPP